MLSAALPVNASSFGGQIDSVYHYILVLVIFWFIVTEGLILGFCLRYRRRPGQRSVHVRGDRKGQLAWVLVPALVVVCLDFSIDASSHRVWHAIKLEQPPPDIEVAVTGKQFNWIFTYPGQDGKLGTVDDVTIESELHVPVDKVVRLTLTSQDVIHSFWVPNLRLKQDVVPGRHIPIWFKATKVGTWEIACSELCGFGHYSMHGTLVVHDPAEYARWLHDHMTPAAAEK